MVKLYRLQCRSLNPFLKPFTFVLDQMETIEIILVVIDLETLEIVDEFQRFVRPQINPILIDFCKALTSIEQSDVDGASTYAEVGQELGAFIARYPNAAWASWGNYDARQLERDAGFAACPSLFSGLQHFNVRKWHKGLYDDQPRSLKETLESLGLVWEGTYHRGIDDARNVTSIIKEMLG
ncbi:exonuclease domain-containing protein [Pseudomonas zeae]|uniref:3'-5' exonuclease n=1 Tax=Pseudomonas zeae TaxID=2745510 RepID=UPI002148A02D|nr:3'-5' exonuclease [Pseudomonas zeae]UUT14763.1 exonuclease domain-containing protein [Pseudomonas zeae]